MVEDQDPLENLINDVNDLPQGMHGSKHTDTESCAGLDFWESMLGYRGILSVGT